MSNYFLKWAPDMSTGKFVISTQGVMKSGLEFLILCDSKEEAANIINRINKDELKLPTIDSKGFTFLPEFDYLAPTRVFKMSDPWKGPVS